MGMAASQARLLAITARIHDVEYQAQSIQNAKVQLATKSDQVYQDYLDALDATTLTIKDYDGNKIAANFDNLCGFNAVNTKNQYALFNEAGKLIVPDDIEQGYRTFLSSGANIDDPYAFAMFMMAPETLEKDEFDNVSPLEKLFGNNQEALVQFALSTGNESIINIQNEMDDLLTQKDSKGNVLKDENNNTKRYTYEQLSAENRKKYDELEAKRNWLIFKTYAQTLFEDEDYLNQSDFDQTEFNYYANYYKRIQAAGDCISINEYNGLAGNAATDAEWLQNMLQAGKITIDIWTIDNKNGQVSLQSTGVSSDSYLEYTTTSSIDKKALAKAEAEYEYAMKQIDRKDKQYDNELSKLETERSALTTQYDSIKKVIQDNIERTFGIFS